MKEILAAICAAFRIPGEIIAWNQISGGNINTTYKVVCDNNGEVKEYLAQKVNVYVFRDPISMMRNIDLVTEHIMKKNEEQGITERRYRLHFHHTDEGKNYYFVGNDFWRISNFIENSTTFDGSADLTVLTMTGKAFGRFERQLQDFDASQLVETIPHFHDTRLRMQHFEEDVAADPCGRVAECRNEIETILNNKALACRLNEMLDDGKLFFRVTHNDTKTNNVMYDKDTLEPLIVVDLDTVMPGLAAFDFGDAVRFACNTAAEDEEDLSKVSLSYSRYKAFAEGYITEAADFLTDAELDSMVLGVATITLELAMRFLDDYLTGDKYFKIKNEKHNLIRTKCQLTLFRDIMGKYDDLDRIVHEVAASVKG